MKSYTEKVEQEVIKFYNSTPKYKTAQEFQAFIRSSLTQLLEEIESICCADCKSKIKEYGKH